MVDALSKLEANENDLASFKAYLEAEIKKDGSTLADALSGVQYTYALNPTIYTKNTDGEIIKSDTGELMMEMIGDFMLTASGNDKAENPMVSGSSGGMSSMMMNSMMGMDMWQELLPDLAEDEPINHILKDQYDVIYGAWPNEYDEIVLIVNEKNEIDDLTLYAMGLLSRAEIDAIIDAAAHGKTLDAEIKSWSYADICKLTFRAIMPYDIYREGGDGVFVDVSDNANMLKVLYEDALQLKVVGILRPSEDAETAMVKSAIGYTHELTEYIIREAAEAAVVKAQKASPTVDVLTGLPFKSNTGALSDEKKQENFLAYIAEQPREALADIYVEIQCLNAIVAQLDAQVDKMMAMMQDKDALITQISTGMSGQVGMSEADIAAYLAEMTLEELKEMMRPAMEEQISAGIAGQVKAGMAQIPDEQKIALFEAELPKFTLEQNALYYDELTEFSDSTYDANLVRIGSLDLDKPQTINLYASTFENKDIIVETIANYNDTVDEAQRIAYTDYLGIMMSSITTIINAITYVLIAFVAISLVVSSIMIGVITLISVQERTKEIGILRAIGASKKNVSRMFNAETMIIGFASGMLGVVVTYLLCIPINMILYALTDIANLRAFLPIEAAVILVVISVMLTLISGIIPSRSAAKKDPVVALRTE
jgi:putative ABC transport system permease protein